MWSPPWARGGAGSQVVFPVVPASFTFLLQVSHGTSPEGGGPWLEEAPCGGLGATPLLDSQWQPEAWAAVEGHGLGDTGPL